MSSSKRTFYVTTPIYYPTARPHLGSLYSTVLADVAARWHQLRGDRVCMVTGTDEHGQKVAQVAEAAGKTPQDFVDSLALPFIETWRAYHIDYTRFMRTTDADHREAVQLWVRQLVKQGDIYRATYEGFYCTPCETFVLEREQEGDPKCPSCGRETIVISEPSYFFKLSSYQEKILAWYDTHPDFILPRERMNEVRAFVAGGLRDLAISRSRTNVSWGIPFPDDLSQIVYVWADALNNYVSAVGYGNPDRQTDFNTWWPAQLHVLGKDIIRFHAVYWPAFLMAAGLQLPEHLLVHGWIKMGDLKMSKSLGNVIDPMVLEEKYGADLVRYYLVRYLAVTHDAPFTIDDLETRTNADLANDLGNLLQRIVSLAIARECTTLRPPQRWGERETALHEAVGLLIRELCSEMEVYMFHRAYAHVWRAIGLVNSYLQEEQPWKLKIEQRDEFERVLCTAAQILGTLALLIWPVMPRKMEKLLDALGLSWEGIREKVMYDGVGIPLDMVLEITKTKGDPLFPKIELKNHELSDRIHEMETDGKKGGTIGGETMEESIVIADFARIALVVGTIVEVDVVPKSDKLYRLTVDLGSWGMRTICSGVRAHFAPNDLQGKQGVFLANLAPRALMGITSQGMMLCAEDAAGKLQLVSTGALVANGTRLR